MNFYGKKILWSVRKDRNICKVWPLLQDVLIINQNKISTFNDTSNPKVYNIEYIDWKSGEKDPKFPNQAICPEKASIRIKWRNKKVHFIFIIPGLNPKSMQISNLFYIWSYPTNPPIRSSMPKIDSLNPKILRSNLW